MAEVSNPTNHVKAPESFRGDFNSPSNRSLIDAIIEAISQDHRVLFAHLYGSFAELGGGNDFDLAVYALGSAESHGLSADLC